MSSEQTQDDFGAFTLTVIPVNIIVTPMPFRNTHQLRSQSKSMLKARTFLHYIEDLPQKIGHTTLATTGAIAVARRENRSLSLTLLCSCEMQTLPIYSSYIHLHVGIIGISPDWPCQEPLPSSLYLRPGRWGSSSDSW